MQLILKCKPFLCNTYYNLTPDIIAVNREIISWKITKYFPYEKPYCTGNKNDL